MVTVFIMMRKPEKSHDDFLCGEKLSISWHTGFVPSSHHRPLWHLLWVVAGMEGPSSERFYKAAEPSGHRAIWVYGVVFFFLINRLKTFKKEN